MRKVILYIAMSLDGYIADSDGNIDWLGGEDPEYKGDYGYQQFIDGVDTVIMGYNTYHQVTTELAPNAWPYAGMATYVMTRKQLADQPDITFTAESVADLLKRLKLDNGKNIWICGGANLVNQVMSAELIDEYHLSIMPIMLGGGIRLFDASHPQQALKLVQTADINGILDVIYRPR